MQLQQLLQDHLPGFFVGLGSSSVILLVQQLLQLVRNRKRNSTYKNLVGDYTEYTIALRSTEAVISASLSIRLRFGRLRVKLSTGIYDYKGILEVVGSNLYIRLEAVSHRELMQTVYSSPAADRINAPLVGVTSAINQINEPYAFMTVLSPVDLSDDQVFTLLGSTLHTRRPYSLNPRLDLDTFSEVSIVSDTAPGSH